MASDLARTLLHWCGPLYLSLKLVHRSRMPPVSSMFNTTSQALSLSGTAPFLRTMPGPRTLTVAIDPSLPILVFAGLPFRPRRLDGTGDPECHLLTSILWVREHTSLRPSPRRTVAEVGQCDGVGGSSRIIRMRFPPFLLIFSSVRDF